MKKCPKCGGPLVIGEGYVVCPVCGHEELDWSLGDKAMAGAIFLIVCSIVILLVS